MATVAEVAGLLGISGRRVKELRAEGVLPGAPHEPYDLSACCLAYCARLRAVAGNPDEDGQTVDEARRRLTIAQAEAAELRAASLSAEAVSVQDVEIVVTAMLDRICVGLQSLPARAAPVVITLTTAAAVQAELTRVAFGILGEMACTEVVSSLPALSGAGGSPRAEQGGPNAHRR